MTIARYITSLLALRVLGALLAITALLQVFDLFNNARDLLSRGGTGADLVTYAALRAPVTIEQALPIAMLVGALSTLLGLTRSREMSALRSAGITMYQLLGKTLPITLVAAIAHFILVDRVVPWSERHFASWWNSFEAPGDNRARGAIWLRNASAILRVLDVQGESLGDVEIVRLSADGLVRQWIRARSAERIDGTWTLTDVRTTTVGDGEVQVGVAARQPWPGSLDPATIGQMASGEGSLSGAELRQVLQGRMAGGQSPSYYATQLHRRYATPLASALMILLASPAAYMIGRRPHTGVGLALGFGLGMSYLVTDGVLGALGGAGMLPPLMAAWIPPAMFALIGASVLLYYEE